ncbi:unnamed protein product, partial [marine sediment metagenome]
TPKADSPCVVPEFGGATYRIEYDGVPEPI